jgi:hypothetical protein
MNAKVSHAATIAAHAVKSVVNHVAASSHVKSVKAAVNKMTALWGSLLQTSVTFAVLVALTLAFDKWVFHYLFYVFGDGADPVIVTMCKAAKYTAIAVELVSWVVGVIRDCKDHFEE